jgi:hypothetical protein
MARGGKRAGTPGKAYGNRTDMNQAQAKQFVGQSYGTAAKQAEVQASVPSGPTPGPSAGPQGAQAPAGPVTPPGALGAFDRPTERPGTPITNGLPSGPGAGPEALGLTKKTDPVTLQIRALFQMYPTQELADILADLQ